MIIFIIPTQIISERCSSPLTQWSSGNIYSKRALRRIIYCRPKILTNGAPLGLFLFLLNDCTVLVPFRRFWTSTRLLCARISYFLIVFHVSYDIFSSPCTRISLLRHKIISSWYIYLFLHLYPLPWDWLLLLVYRRSFKALADA